MDDLYIGEDSYDTRKRGRGLETNEQQAVKRVNFGMF